MLTRSGASVAGATILALLLVGCGAQTTVAPSPSPTGPPVEACSAAGMDTSMFTENPDLTGQANEARRHIAARAVTCDYEDLAALTDEDFTYSFGDVADPAAFWRAREEAGEPVLRYLVTLLTLDTHVDEAGPDEDQLRDTLYTWPRAHRVDDEQARSEVETAFGAGTVERWFGPEGYVGWRVGIRGDGSWSFYVAGD